MKIWNKLFVWGLLLSARLIPSSSSNWLADESSEIIPQGNPYLFNSLCNTHGHFVNKVTTYTPEIEYQNRKIERRRRLCEKLIVEKLKDLDAQLSNKEYTLFKSNHHFAPIKDYLKLIVDLTEQAKIRRNEYTGYCGEATAASIVNSLLEQLITGVRESVQLLTITDQHQDIGHVFALYNGAHLKSQWLDNEKIKILIKDVRSPQKGTPVVCDEFSNFHGVASEWPDLFFNAKDHDYGKATYVYMDVINYTLPTIHKKFNSKQKAFIKDTLIELLSSVKTCDVNEAIAYCRH